LFLAEEAAIEKGNQIIILSGETSRKINYTFLFSKPDKPG